MRVRINRQTAKKLNHRGKALGMEVVRELDNRTFLIRVSGTTKTLVVGA